ncbi:MAG TPA: DUF4175 family protein [Bacteroidota bacterium]|nr:DUF4175 family protein [Bacteroidota bacterium]
MPEQVRPYDEILRRLDSVVRTRIGYDLLRGAMLTIAAAAALLICAVVVEQAFSAGRTFRFWIFTSLIVILAAAAAWFVGRPALYLAGTLRGPGPLEVARFVGDRLPGIRDRLVDAMEMFPEKERLAGHYSPGLIDSAFASVWAEVRDIDFTGVVSNASARMAVRAGAAAAGAVVALVIVFPGWFGSSLGRIVQYDRAFAAEPAIVVEVHPGDIEVVRGQPVTITVRVTGDGGDRIDRIAGVLLNTRPDGRIDFESVRLADTSARVAGGPAVFTAQLPPVKYTTEYYASAGETESRKHIITVVDRPIVKSFRLSVKPPAYAGLPERELDLNVGDIAALPGSTVRIELAASKELASAQMVFHDSVVVGMTAERNRITGSFRVRREDRYRFRLEDGGGLTNPDPIDYTVRTVPDEYPMVEIVAPGKNLDIVENSPVNLALKIRDDYGFSRLRLHYRMEHSRYEQPAREYTSVDLPLGRSGESGEDGFGRQDIYYQWDISKMSLVPEDVVGYYAEVFDNDNVSGPKSSRSQAFILRLPSLEEVLADVNNSSDKSLGEMQKMSEEMQSLKESLEDLNREVKKQRDKVDWQQQKKAEQLAQRYEALRQKAEKTAQSMEEMVKKMDENDLLSESTLEKYKELQKLMEELNSEELKEALKKLQESMKKLTPEEIREAMNKLTMSEEQFRKNLERMVELLKRIHIEQKIDELIKRAEEMKERQDALSQKTKDDASRPDAEKLSAEQSDLSKQAESLEKEASDLGKKMEEFSKEMPLDEMNKASQSLEQKDVPQKMQNSSSKMQAGQMQASRQDQEQASKDLSEFSEQMEGVRDALREKQMQQVVNEMRRQIQNLLDLSKNQEAIKDETSGMEPNSQRFRDAAQSQQETREGLGSVANAMTELSKKTFAVGPDLGREMGNAMKRMSDAMDQIEQRNPGESSRQQREAMGSMNRAAMMMQGALNGMMDAQGQMGMAGLMGRLGQMAGQQQGINQGTQQAGGQPGEQNGITAAQMAAYGRLAGEQGSVKKSLQELAQEAKESGEFSKILGDLDRIAQEMQEVQTNLSQGEVNPETLQKQDRILSRLLESQKSLRERDYEKKRTAGTGTNVRRASPADINFGTQEGKNILREELFQVREGKYARDYEELIRKYFEQLEQAGPDQPK